MEDSSNSNVGCNGEIVLVTPTKKQELLKFELQSLNTDSSPTSDGDNSSVSSMNEGCESPLSSWESEPETDIPSLINCDGMPDQRSLQSINLEENYLDMEQQNQFVGVENTDDGLLWEMDNKSYEELLKKFLEKEEELRVSNFKLQFSEQEIIKLIAKVHNSEAQRDNVCEELKLKEEELKKQKELSEEEIYKLRIQIQKSRNRLDNVQEELNLKVEKLNKKKELSEEEILKLKTQIEKSEIQLNNVNEELKLKEEELNVQKEHSEEEIFKLKIQIEKSENQLNNVNGELKRKEEELNKQNELSEKAFLNYKFHIEQCNYRINNVNEELKLKEEELNKQKELSEEEILKLKTQIEKSEIKAEEVNLKQEEMKKQIAELNTQIPEFVHEIASMMEQLQVALKKLKISNDEIAFLRMELESKSSETNQLQGQLEVTQEIMAKSELELVSKKTQNQFLGDMVKMYEEIETNQEQQVQKLKSELLDTQAKFSFDVASLSKMNTELTSKLKDCDSRNKELKNKVRQYEAEKLNQEELHATQKIVLQDEIMSLRRELEQRMYDGEATNKELDMVMNERDEANDMIDDLKAEICSRDDKISNMKKYTDDVKTSLKELMVEYNTALNEVYNLNLRVGELEKEVTRQNGVISDTAEEKKEAIRQLCFSLEDYKSKLEHYKNGYNELLQTLYG